jgi:hypothetical protein
VTRPPDFATAYAGRLLMDAWIDASAKQWRRRAEQFDAVATRPGDYLGRSTPEQRRERVERCAAAAQACRNRAAYLEASLAEFLETLTVVALEDAA